MKWFTFKKGGVHPEENKLTADLPTQPAALPAQAVFMLSQHIGAPAKAVVKRGDKVKVGTLLAEAGGFVSAPVYSSVSGTVAKIDNVIDATGTSSPPSSSTLKATSGKRRSTAVIRWRHWTSIPSSHRKRLSTASRSPG